MRRSVYIILCILGLCAFAVLSWYGIGGYMDKDATIRKLEAENAKLMAPPQLTTDGDVIARVGTFMVLPNGVPTVVLVADVDTLKKTQPFFAAARNGDKLLVYPSKVILYSPALDKIVEVAQIKKED